MAALYLRRRRSHVGSATAWPGLVSASRSIAGAHAKAATDPAESARSAAEQLREEAWALA